MNSNMNLNSSFCLYFPCLYSLESPLCPPPLTPHVTASDSSCLPFCLQLLYTGRVREDVTPGHFILKVSAVDADMDTNAQITYSLHGPGAQEFRLDPHTGKCLRCGMGPRPCVPAMVGSSPKQEVTHPPVHPPADTSIWGHMKRMSEFRHSSL